MKGKLLIALIFIAGSLCLRVSAQTCGGRGYTGLKEGFCIKCHREGCPVLHPVGEIEIVETKCLRIPQDFPLTRNGRMTCTTCHDMTSRNPKFLRARKPLRKRFDFCYECHNAECYKKFNPHETIGSDLDWKEKKKACIYCHGAGARLSAYKACVGCHTETPHVGAPEHLKASREDVAKLVKGNKNIVDITDMKELKPEINEDTLRKRKARMILVNGRIECITCHNPHPQIAIEAPAVEKEWMEMMKKDLDYKLEKLREDFERYELNEKEVKLMSESLSRGKLCKECHSINSLK